MPLEMPCIFDHIEQHFFLALCYTLNVSDCADLGIDHLDLHRLKSFAHIKVIINKKRDE